MAFPSVTQVLNHVFGDLLNDGSLKMSAWMGNVGDWLNGQAGGNPGDALVKISGADGDFGFQPLAPLSNNDPLGNGAADSGVSGEASRSDHVHPAAASIAWSTYTPAIAAPAAGSTMGNAAVVGRYVVIGRTCHFVIAITRGSTTVFNQVLKFTLPVARANNQNDVFPTIVQKGGTEVWAAGQTMSSEVSNTTRTVFSDGFGGLVLGNLAGDNIPNTSGVPFQPANSGDKWLISGTYETT